MRAGRPELSAMSKTGSRIGSCQPWSGNDAYRARQPAGITYDKTWPFRYHRGTNLTVGIVAQLPATLFLAALTVFLARRLFYGRFGRVGMEGIAISVVVSLMLGSLGYHALRTAAGISIDRLALDADQRKAVHDRRVFPHTVVDEYDFGELQGVELIWYGMGKGGFRMIAVRLTEKAAERRLHNPGAVSPWFRRPTDAAHIVVPWLPGRGETLEAEASRIGAYIGKAVKPT